MKPKIAKNFYEVESIVRERARPRRVWCLAEPVELRTERELEEFYRKLESAEILAFSGLEKLNEGALDKGILAVFKGFGADITFPYQPADPKGSWFVVCQVKWPEKENERRYQNV